MDLPSFDLNSTGSSVRSSLASSSRSSAGSVSSGENVTFERAVMPMSVVLEESMSPTKFSIPLEGPDDSFLQLPVRQHDPRSKLSEWERDHSTKLSTGYKCNICCKYRPDANKLKEHLRSHTGEKPFQCQLCSYSSAIKLGLDCHMKSHRSEELFFCDLCDFRISNNRSLVRHKKDYHGDDRFDFTSPQRSCVKATHQSSSMGFNVQNSSNGGFVVCQDSSPSLSAKAILQQTLTMKSLLQDKTPPAILKRSARSLLNRETPVKRSLEDLSVVRPVLQESSENEQKVSLMTPQIQSEGLPVPKRLLMPLAPSNNIASDEKPITCMYCKDGYDLYSSDEQLLSHWRRDHPQERRHWCPVCLWSFQHVDNLTRHMSSYHGEGFG